MLRARPRRLPNRVDREVQFKASQEIPYVDYAAWAQLIGLKGIKVTKSAEIEEAWRVALSADRPVIISALTDANEAPLPPHITFEQAEGFAKSVIKVSRGRHRRCGGVVAREGPRIHARSLT